MQSFNKTATSIFLSACLVACGSGGGDGGAATPANSQPIANAGQDVNALLGKAINLNGGLSKDNENDKLTYNWEILSRPANSAAVLINPTSKNPSITPDQKGDYEIKLVVSDGKLESLADVMKVTAYTVNIPPVANAGTDLVIPVGVSVPLDGSASHDDDGDPITYDWKLSNIAIGSNPVLQNNKTEKPSFLADIKGRYQIDLTVQDGKNNNVDSLTIDAVSVSAMGISPANRSIPLGVKGKQFIASATLDDGSKLDVSSGVTWSSSDPKIATIDTKGFALPISEGVVNIKAAFGANEVSTQLTITPVELGSLYFFKVGGNPTVEILDGQSIKITVIGVYTDGKQVDLTEQATWSIPFFDAAFAVVSNNVGSKGLVTSIKSGEAMVNAKVGDVDETIFVTIK